MWIELLWHHSWLLLHHPWLLLHHSWLLLRHRGIWIESWLHHPGLHSHVSHSWLLNQMLIGCLISVHAWHLFLEVLRNVSFVEYDDHVTDCCNKLSLGEDVFVWMVGNVVYELGKDLVCWHSDT